VIIIPLGDGRQLEGLHRLDNFGLCLLRVHSEGGPRIMMIGSVRDQEVSYQKGPSRRGLVIDGRCCPLIGLTGPTSGSY